MNKSYSPSLLLGLGLVFSCFSLLMFPREISASIQQALATYASTIFPSLFPFFILTSLVVDLGFSQWLGSLLAPVTTRFFHLNNICSGTLVLGFIGGYPSGAKAVVQLYQQHQCSRPEAHCMLSFCNNCGPSFFIGIVGSTIFHDTYIGIFLYFIHILSSLAVGFLFCSSHSDLLHQPAPTPFTFHAVSFPVALIHAVTGAFHSLLNICAFFLFFAVLIRILICTGISPLLSSLLSTVFHLLPAQANSLLYGLLEITSGIVTLPNESTFLNLLLCSFLLAWGSWSVHIQTLSLLSDTDLSAAPYLLGKLLHALFCSVFCAAALLPAFRPILLLTLFLSGAVLFYRKKAVAKRRKVYYNNAN